MRLHAAISCPTGATTAARCSRDGDDAAEEYNRRTSTRSAHMQARSSARPRHTPLPGDLVKREAAAAEVNALSARLDAAAREAEAINAGEKMFGWPATKWAAAAQREACPGGSRHRARATALRGYCS